MAKPKPRDYGYHSVHVKESTVDDLKESYQAFLKECGGANYSPLFSEFIDLTLRLYRIQRGLDSPDAGKYVFVSDNLPRRAILYDIQDRRPVVVELDKQGNYQANPIIQKLLEQKHPAFIDLSKKMIGKKRRAKKR